MPVLTRYAVGKDFTEADFNKWREQLLWWIGDRFPRIKDPREHVDKILKAALNGTKLDGSEWVGVSHDFFARVVMLSGFDVKRGVGIRDPQARRIRNSITSASGEKTVELPPVDIKKEIDQRDLYIKDLLRQYPHLDNPIYKPKVEELAETVMKSRMMSTDFILANDKKLELLSKIRESLHKQIGELMSFLEISPEQRVKKQLNDKNVDVGSMVAKLESYGEVWEEYEKLDALRELIQKYKMLKALRPDGTPQLNDWELWHMTRNRPVKFTCRCGASYELLGGFTPEEIEQALIQAQKVYGFGLEAIGDATRVSTETIKKIAEEGFAAEDVLEPPKEEDAT